MEEQIALPVHIGHFLAPMLAGTVRVSSTTQSPAMVVDSPLYPLRNQLRFSDGAGERRIYNTPNGAALTVLVPDADGSVPSALLRQLPGDRLVLRWRSAR